MRRVAGAVAALAVMALGAPAAQARDAIVTSFDGTAIVTHFFPAPGLGPGERAPTIMVGHGWGGSGAESPPPAYAEAGYNVLTWDARGFGGSGGTVMIDHPEFEGRDAQALIDFIAAQPEAQLDAPGDPRVGMDGPSYGGGIQFITAARDGRVDAIAPTIAWNSLNRSLYRSEVVRAGWDLALVGLGIPTSLLPGLLSPAGVQTGHQSEQFYDAVVEGVSTGQLSPEFQAWLAEHGPRGFLDRIHAPTLIAQGTVDTLFTLDEAHDNHVALKQSGVPLKMVWFCGGHGLCRTGDATITGDALVEERKLQWFARYLKGNESVDTGPAFEWVDERGTYHASGGYPLKQIATERGSGSGTIALTPGVLPTSGVLIFATPSPGGVSARVDAAPGSEIVGAPTLRLVYAATGVSTRPDGRTAIFAQLVDRRRDVVVGNQATPVPIELDGQRHEIELPLETVASVATEAGYELQLVPQTSVYDVQRASGVVDVELAEATLPVTAPVGPQDAKRCKRIAGKHGKDRLRGTRGDDCVRGRRGADRISGRAGRDRIHGGPGRDRIRSGPGRDRVDCGPGRDTAVVDRKRDRVRRCERVRRR